MSCPEYIELYRNDPQRCLSPAAEAKVHRLGNTPQARAVRRDERLRVRFAALEDEVRTQADRWRTPPDLLDQ